MELAPVPVWRLAFSAHLAHPPWHFTDFVQTGRGGEQLSSCTRAAIWMEFPPFLARSQELRDQRGPRGGDIGRRSPPGSSEEMGWAGCGPGGPTWPLGR
jgi:hypothetical protein